MRGVTRRPVATLPYRRALLEARPLLYAAIGILASGRVITLAQRAERLLKLLEEELKAITPQVQ